MVKKKTNILAQELKKALENKKVVIGSERTIKLLKKGLLKKVIISKNCNERVVKLIEHYAKISSVEIKKTIYTSEKLGALCKKPFLIAVLGILE